ncbi:hypothetical protein KY334_03740 [Candidatus Woesearchaeota archaeon]|nr:hypothetical protein [Candidatus Woesearchaeota archaeon]
MVSSQVEALTKIIIGIAIFLIILTPILYFTGDSGEQNSLVQKCKIEVVKASKISLLTGEARKKLKNQDFADCPRIELGTLDLPDDQDQAERRLAKILVDEYYDCWDKFGKGTLNPYSTNGIYQNTVQDKKCYICSTFTSPGDYELEDDMKQYLETFPDKLEFFISGLLIDKDENVYYSISKLDTKDDVFEFTDIEKRDLDFEKDEVYHLVYVLVVDGEGRGWGAGAFWGFNTYDTTSKMVIVKDSDLDKTCRYLEN